MTYFDNFKEFFRKYGMTDEDIAYLDREAFKDAAVAFEGEDYTVEELHEMGCDHMIDCLECEPEDLLEYYGAERMKTDALFRSRVYEMYYQLRKEWDQFYYRTELEQTYAQSADRTFILEHTYQYGHLVKTTVVGFYSGEPTAENLKQYKYSGAVATY